MNEELAKLEYIGERSFPLLTFCPAIGPIGQNAKAAVPSQNEVYR